MRGSGVFSELVFVAVVVDGLLEPVACRLRGLARVDVSVFSSGQARLRVGLRSPTIVDRRRSYGTVGVTLAITLSKNHDHHHVRSSRWSVRWNPVHHCETFRQSRGAGFFIVYTFKADVTHSTRRKTPSGAAVDQRDSAFDERSNSRRPRIGLHEGFSRYCIPPLNRNMSYKANLTMCPRI
jgi:hypothetical protein